jgi:DNA repair protein RadC
LIDEFGTLADVLRSPPAAHIRVLGHVRAWRQLQPVRRAIRHYHHADLRRGSLLDSWQQVLEYLRVELAAMPVEHFRVLYLDGRNHLLGDEVLSAGTVDQCQVYVRELIVRALDLHASNLILVHNHPSGDSTPSQPDIRLTRQIVEVARNLGIAVHDHIVIARDGYTSMRAQGLI